MIEKNAIEVVQFAKQCLRSEYDQEGLDMAITSLEVCGKLKEVGCCHNYQHERADLAEWIDEVNKLIRQLNQNNRR